eukprot:13750610-Alexandrium_andersonii.AAC.1
MSASLVGSEMCIRDSSGPARVAGCWRLLRRGAADGAWWHRCSGGVLIGSCLLYTSDAADDM